jgi:RHS repeat-associated protein
MLEDNQYYFYHNDHLGTPEKITDRLETTIWSVTYTSFGEARIDQAAILMNDLRFPGQYFDEETGVNYNWNRYYGFYLGKYMQVDPLGFAGGDVNLYGYVNNSAINMVDPFGLTSCPFSVASYIKSNCKYAKRAAKDPNEIRVMLIQSGFENAWGTATNILDDNNYFGMHGEGDAGYRHAKKDPDIKMPKYSAPQQAFNAYMNRVTASGITYKDDAQFINEVVARLKFSVGTESHYKSSILKMINKCKSELASCKCSKD